VKLFERFRALSRTKKVLLLGVFVFAVLFVGIRLQTNAKKQSPRVSTVTRGTISEELTLSGEIEADEHVRLGFQTGGMLAWVGVKEGDTVGQYQAIASLDVRALRKTIDKYLNTYMKTRWDFEQTKDDYTDTVDVGLTQEVRDRAKRILEQSQFDLNNSVTDVELQNLSMEYATLATPIAGIVTRIDTPYAGVNILATQQPFEIINPQTVYFQVNADQTEVIKLGEGQKTEIMFDSYPQDLVTGSIALIAFVPKENETATVYSVRIQMDNVASLSGRLRLGMTGDATFILSQKQDVLQIPLLYVKSDDSGKYVYISKDRKKAYIETGIENTDHTEVITGLKEGDRVYD